MPRPQPRASFCVGAGFKPASSGRNALVPTPRPSCVGAGFKPASSGRNAPAPTPRPSCVGAGFKPVSSGRNASSPPPCLRPTRRRHASHRPLHPATPPPPDRRAASQLRGNSQGLRVVFERRSNLPGFNAREPIQKLANRSAAFEVLEEGGQGHPGSGERPRPAELAGTTFDRRALLPVCHAVTSVPQVCPAPHLPPWRGLRPYQQPKSLPRRPLGQSRPLPRHRRPRPAPPRPSCVGAGFKPASSGRNALVPTPRPSCVGAGFKPAFSGRNALVPTPRPSCVGAGFKPAFSDRDAPTSTPRPSCVGAGFKPASSGRNAPAPPPRPSCVGAGFKPASSGRDASSPPPCLRTTRRRHANPRPHHPPTGCPPPSRPPHPATPPPPPARPASPSRRQRSAACGTPQAIRSVGARG